MKSPSAVMRELINELTTPDEERAWSTWWADVCKLLDADVDPTSPAAEDLARRLHQVCLEHSLGDPYIYAQWAPFIVRVNRTDTAEGANERAWKFLAQAVQVRAASRQEPD